MSRDARQGANRWGRRAELFAMLALMLKGYRLVGRNIGGKGGEIDLLMRRGDVIAVVEVKARVDHQTALASITPAKARLMARSLRHWLTRNPWAMSFNLRGDVVLVRPWAWPRHLPDAIALPLQDW